MHISSFKAPGKSFKGKMLALWVLLVVPLVALLLIYTTYTARIVRQRTTEANAHTLDLYCSLLQKDIDGMNAFVSTLISGQEFQMLQLPLAPIEAQGFERQVLKQYRGILQTNSTAGGFFIYSPKNNCYGSAFGQGFNTKDQIELIFGMMEWTKSNLPERYGNTFLHELNGRHYLINMQMLRGVCCAYTISLDTILAGAKQNEQGEYLAFSGERQGILASSNGGLSDAGSFSRDSLRFLSPGGEIFDAVWRPLNLLGLSLVYLTPQSNMVGMTVTQILLLSLTAAALVLLPVVYQLMRRHFFSPLTSMTETMRGVRQGDMALRMDARYPIEEFEQIATAFNEMLEQIQSLKIESYERQLASQRARLQYLQVQLRPHFFLNCLKNLYGMAEEQRYDRIQELILALSSYWRYIMQDSLLFVSLERELAIVNNYIELMTMTMSSPPTCVITADDSLLALELPPLTILTFVENALKHGAALDRPLEIFVKCILIEGEDTTRLNISIQDNGEGFTPEALELLNRQDPLIYRGEKIGVSNVRQRLAILYQNECGLSFFNQAGGARVELFLPARHASDALWKG